MRIATGLVFAVLVAPFALSGNALAQMLPNYEILPANGVANPLAISAVAITGSWSAWKVDRVNNKVSLCSVSLVGSVPPTPPTPNPPGPIMPLVPVSPVVGNATLTANPTCVKYAAFSGNAGTSAFASTGQGSLTAFLNNNAFWSVDLTTGVVTFCLAGSGCVTFTDK